MPERTSHCRPTCQFEYANPSPETLSMWTNRTRSTLTNDKHEEDTRHTQVHIGYSHINFWFLEQVSHLPARWMIAPARHGHKKRSTSSLSYAAVKSMFFLMAPVSGQANKSRRRGNCSCCVGREVCTCSRLLPPSKHQVKKKKRAQRGRSHVPFVIRTLSIH